MVDMVKSPQTGCWIGRTVISWHIAALVQEVPLAKAVTELTTLCSEAGVRTIYTPHVALGNAMVVDADALSDTITLPKGIALRKNSARPADGVLFSPQKGERSPRGFMCTIRGCMIIIMRLGDIVCVAHAGRESLFNRADDPSRHPSVVDAMVHALTTKGKQLGQGDVQRIRVSMHYSIRAADFAHDLADSRTAPLTAWAGKHLLEHSCWYVREYRWLHLDLPEIGAHQCRKLGIPAAQIDLSDAYLPNDAPTTRNGRPGRSLVMVNIPT